MNFKDFENNLQDLVGKTVLYESGFSYSNSKSLTLLKIEKVTKTGFRLFTMPDKLFGFDGWQKGLNSIMDMATISRCELVTEDKANVLRETWMRNKEEMQLREKVKQDIHTCTFEQLQKINQILTA